MMAKDKEQKEPEFDGKIHESDTRFLAKAMAAGLLGFMDLVSTARQRRKSTLIKEMRDLQNPYGIRLEGMAVGTINIHVDPIKHPYLTLLGNVIHLFKQNNQKRRAIMNKNMIIGGVAAGIIGVTAALLLAPKSGNRLLHDLYKPLEPALRFALGKKQGRKQAKSHSKSEAGHSKPHTKSEAGHSNHPTKSHEKVKKTASTVKRASVKRSVAKKGNHSSVENAAS